MSKERSNHSSGPVKPLTEKKDINFRILVSSEWRPALILCFLATDDSQQSLGLSDKIGIATVNKIISESEEIYAALKEPCPNNLKKSKTCLMQLVALMGNILG